MPAFGRYNQFPLKLGGGRSNFEVEHAALLDALADLYDPSESTTSWIELYAQARVVAMIWSINRRLANQAIPMKMIDMLPSWEEVCRLRPADGDPVHARRARVAAKLRGVADNTLTGLTDSCAALLGTAFVELRTVAPGKEVVYWPGQYPGPPGYEWSSNRCTFAVVVKQGALDNVSFKSLVERTYQMLDAMAPAWMTFQVGTNGGGFVCGQGIVGLTLL